MRLGVFYIKSQLLSVWYFNSLWWDWEKVHRFFLFRISVISIPCGEIGRQRLESFVKDVQTFQFLVVRLGEIRKLAEVTKEINFNSLWWDWERKPPSVQRACFKISIPCGEIGSAESLAKIVKKYIFQFLVVRLGASAFRAMQIANIISIPCGEIGSVPVLNASISHIIFQFLVVRLGGYGKCFCSCFRWHFNSLWWDWEDFSKLKRQKCTKISIPCGEIGRSNTLCLTLCKVQFQFLVVRLGVD